MHRDQHQQQDNDSNPETVCNRNRRWRIPEPLIHTSFTRISNAPGAVLTAGLRHKF
jgi:hypothetical protein